MIAMHRVHFFRALFRLLPALQGGVSVGTGMPRCRNRICGQVWSASLLLRQAAGNWQGGVE